MSDLRVAVFSDAMAERNGVGTYYRDLVEHLEKRLGTVDLLCPAANGQNRLCLFSVALPGDPTQRVFFPKMRSAARRVSQFKPHVIVSATPGPFGALGAMLAKSWNRSLCVGYHTRYDKLVDLYWPPAIAVPCSSILQGWDRFFLRRGDAVVANSADMVENARRLTDHPVFAVGTPLARHLVSAPTKPLTGKIQTILFAGRLAAEKNISQVLEAAAQIPNIHFLVAGDGPLAGVVRETSNRLANLEFLGWVPRRRLAGVMDRSDALVLPSKEEAFGTIALEAMARGRIVMVSSRCGILNWPDLARGLLDIHPGESLAAAIARIERLDAAEKTARAAAGRKSAEAFNNATVENWLQVFRRITRSGAGGMLR